MSNSITVHTKSIHHIDIEENSNEEVNLNGSDNDFNTYLNSLARKVIDKSNDSREFEFNSSTTQVSSQINSIIEDNSQREPLNIISNRLLTKEVEAQERYSQITSIQRGSLLQALFDIEGKSYFMITKVDHDSFLDEDDLQKHIGLPFESYVLKACIIEVEDEEISNIKVFDTQSKIAEYWWNNFLELKEINTNEHNTRQAFTSIHSHLARRLKKKYPSDYTFIRNSLVTYFRTNDSFRYNDMIDSVVGDYEPIDPELEIEDLKDTLRELPESRNFDTSFQIIQDVVKNKFRRTIQLDNKIELKLKEDIENLSDKIQTEESHDGKKYIKIESEKGYRIFKSRNS